METPIYFPNSGYSLFGVLHQPEAAAARRPFVLCHPFAEEKLWAHRVYVSFARRLAALGHAVLRFDYMGNGDSDGEFRDASLATVRSDVSCAIEQVRRVTGAASVNLLGLRFGASVAALVAEERSDVNALVLWAPIVDGARYVQELLRTNLTTQMAVYKEIRHDREALVEVMKGGEPVNVDGYELTFPLYSDIAGIKLASDRKRHAGPCIAIHVERQPGPAPAELTRLIESYPEGAVMFAQEEAFWKEIASFYRQAPNLFDATCDWLQTVEGFAGTGVNLDV